MTLGQIDRLIALIAGAICVAVMLVAGNMRADAGLFPLITGGLGLLANLWLWLTSGRRDADGAPVPETIQVPRLLQWCIALLLMLLLMEPLGTFVVVPLFLLFTLKGLARLGWLTTMLLSLGFTLALYVVFGWLLSVPLPLGVMTS